MTLIEPREELAISISQGIESLDEEILSWKASDRTDVIRYEALQQTIEEINEEIGQLEMLEHIHDGGLVS
jgi:hypothetical protein